jgi:hypothetical protein
MSTEKTPSPVDDAASAPAVPESSLDKFVYEDCSGLTFYPPDEDSD